MKDVITLELTKEEFEILAQGYYHGFESSWADGDPEQNLYEKLVKIGEENGITKNRMYC
jgi:hypothetical protein